MVHLWFAWKKSEHISNFEDNQNTIILEDMNILQHFRALGNQISLKKSAYFSSKKFDARENLDTYYSFPNQIKLKPGPEVYSVFWFIYVWPLMIHLYLPLSMVLPIFVMAIVGVVNVLSNIKIFFEPKCPSLETSGSTNLNQATLTTPKHAKLTKRYFFSLFLEW